MQGGVFVAEEVDVCGEHYGAMSITGEAGRVCDCCCVVQYIKMSICLCLVLYVVGFLFFYFFLSMLGCSGGGWRDYKAGKLELLVVLWSKT